MGPPPCPLRRPPRFFSCVAENCIRACVFWQFEQRMELHALAVLAHTSFAHLLHGDGLDELSQLLGDGFVWLKFDSGRSVVVVVGGCGRSKNQKDFSRQKPPRMSERQEQAEARVKSLYVSTCCKRGLPRLTKRCLTSAMRARATEESVVDINAGGPTRYHLKSAADES
jgi:hypothetical protein